MTRRVVLGAGLLALGVAVVAGPVHRLAGLCALLVGWVTLGVAWPRPRHREQRRRWTGSERVTLILVICFAAFLRLWKLGELPPPLWSDEAQHGLDARRILEQQYRAIYFPANCGQEPLYKYMVATALTVVKNPVIAVRLPAALAGTVLVAVAYFLARWCGGRRLALPAALLLSFSAWPLHFSRIAFRACLGPAVATASLLALADSRCPRRAAASGALAAALLYTYPAFRLFPLIVAGWLLWTTRAGRRSGAGQRGTVAAWFGTFLIVAAPLVVVAYRQPSLMMARTELASLFSEAPRPLPALLRNTVRHLGALTFDGDHNPRHNVPGAPLLTPVTAWLFLVGVPLFLVQQRRVGVLLLLWLLLMLLPGILSVERQAPHALRSLGILPVPYLVAAYPLALLGTARRARLTVAVLLLVAAITDTWRYWQRWPRALAAVDAGRRSLYSFNEDEASLSAWLSGRTQDGPVYLSPQLYLHPTVAYLAPPNRCGYRLARHPAALTQGSVVLCLVERNLWWVRDDSRKNFFDWWKSQGLVSEEEIWEAVVRTHPVPCDLASASDAPMLRAIGDQFPAARREAVGVFTLVRQVSGRAPPDPGTVVLACVADSAGTRGTEWTRFPPGVFQARGTQGCRAVSAEVRQWCGGRLRSIPVSGDGLLVEMMWPGKVRILVEKAAGARAAVELAFVSPPACRWEHPWVSAMRHFRAAYIK